MTDRPHKKSIVTGVVAAALALAMPAGDMAGGFAAYTLAAETAPAREQKSQGNKKDSNRNKKKTAGKKGSTGKRGASKSRNRGGGETSADVKRQKSQVQGEIKQTARKIEMNEQELKTSLTDLEVLGADIKAQEGKVKELKGHITQLDGNISSLQTQIDKDEATLQLMREKYLQAIKKMRLKKGDRSGLAFIFSSKNFNQAMRRIRYLRQFSEWKEKQTKAIAAQNRVLTGRRDALADARKEKSSALSLQNKAKQELEAQQSQKQVLVADLRQNTAALRDVLSKKQAELNALDARISNLIAAEEAKRKQEEQARLERQRQQERLEAQRHEQERKEQERREKAERERLEAQAAAKAQQENTASKDVADTTPAKESRKSVPAKKTGDNNKKKTDKKNNKDYAQARRRRPRADAGNSSTPAGASSGTSAKPVPSKTAPASTPAPKPATESGFGSCRGSLPRPVGGSFKIVSPYGRHAKPGLENVIYDNTGIDVEVSPGAQVKSVYEGTVSGVYQADGFSNVVLVKHGSYYTVYANLSSVNVRSGQKVRQGEVLGNVAQDSANNNRSIFHFEVWKERSRLNPSDWIR